MYYETALQRALDQGFHDFTPAQVNQKLPYLEAEMFLRTLIEYHEHHPDGDHFEMWWGDDQEMVTAHIRLLGYLCCLFPDSSPAELFESRVAQGTRWCPEDSEPPS